MFPLLHDIIGLPSDTPPAEIGCASEKHFKAILDRAAAGDVNAQPELIRLRVAFLNWAYSSTGAHHFARHRIGAS